MPPATGLGQQRLQGHGQCKTTGYCVRQLEQVDSVSVRRRVDPSQMTSVLAGLRHRWLLAVHAPIRVMQSAMRAINVGDWAGLT